MPDFQNPGAFLLLFIIPVHFMLRSRNLFIRISFPVTLSDWDGGTFEWKDGLRNFMSRASYVFMIAGFVLSVGALANPVVYHQEKVYTTRGTDILFVVDTSPSMAVKDVAGMTRLDAARQAIHTLTYDDGGVSF